MMPHFLDKIKHFKRGAEDKQILSTPSLSDRGDSYVTTLISKDPRPKNVVGIVDERDDYSLKGSYFPRARLSNLIYPP